MDPRIENEIRTDDFNKTSFTLSGVNVSFANALRRTMLADIPVVVFKTTPDDPNAPPLANFITNTTRLNNELLKQRLNCIPIHLNPQEYPLERLLLEVDVENKTDSMMICTTEHFKIKDVQTGDYLPPHKIEEIFPPYIPNGNKKYFIEFVRLRPRITDEIPGEKIRFTCKFSLATAHEDACFNVVGTCSYSFTVDKDAMEAALVKKAQEWKNTDESKEAIALKAANWRLLDGLRIIQKDSFQFVINSVCFYSNEMLMVIACNVMNNRLAALVTLMETDELSIEPSQNTMENSYDIKLVNEDYTLGKVLEYLLYTKFFEQMKIMTYCGFKKMHPHDNYSLIRVAYKDPIDKASIKINLKSCVDDAVKVFSRIKSMFVDNRSKLQEEDA